MTNFSPQHKTPQTFQQNMNQLKNQQVKSNEFKNQNAQLSQPKQQHQRQQNKLLNQLTEMPFTPIAFNTVFQDMLNWMQNSFENSNLSFSNFESGYSNNNIKNNQNNYNYKKKKQ